MIIKNRHKYLKWDKGTIINYRPSWCKPYLIYFDDNTINWYSLSSLRSCYQILSFPNDEIKITRAVHLALTTSDFDAFIKRKIEFGKCTC